MGKIDPARRPVSDVPSCPEIPYARTRARGKPISVGSGTSDTALGPLAEIFGPADEATAGLAQLEQSAPLWGDAAEWRELVSRLRAFEVPWGGRARLAGWSVIDLYGLDPVAPRARVGRMGAAFLVALRGHQVVEVDYRAITMVVRTSARLRVYRGEVDAGAVLAWDLPFGAVAPKGDQASCSA
jgi:hypothetical protein